MSIGQKSLTRPQATAVMQEVTREMTRHPQIKGWDICTEEKSGRISGFSVSTDSGPLPETLKEIVEKALERQGLNDTYYTYRTTTVDRNMP